MSDEEAWGVVIAGISIAIVILATYFVVYIPAQQQIDKLTTQQAKEDQAAKTDCLRPNFYNLNFEECVKVGVSPANTTGVEK